MDDEERGAQTSNRSLLQRTRPTKPSEASRGLAGHGESEHVAATGSPSDGLLAPRDAAQPARQAPTWSQLTSFQKLSMYLGRALR